MINVFKFCIRQFQVFNFARFIRMTFCGLFYHGPLSHYFYKTMRDRFPPGPMNLKTFLSKVCCIHFSISDKMSTS